MYLFVILALLALIGGQCVFCFDPESYPNSQAMAPLDYTVYWRVEETKDMIYLALRAKTTGWVGFGIAEMTSGSMPGADIVEGSVTNGSAKVTDRWSDAFATPHIDDCQDWSVVAHDESEGYTTLELKRRLIVTDPQDRSIVPGPNMVIAAHGADGRDTFGYHGTNRVTSEITFYGQSDSVPSPPIPDEMTLDLKMDNFLVPNRVTTYACQTFAMPIDQDYYITQIDPIIDEANFANVHHFVAHVCTNSSTNGIPLIEQYEHPAACTSPLGTISRGCTGILSAWAAGGGPIYTPPEAGFAMGAKDNAIKYLILEVHYNNPTGVGGYIDNSGIRLHYTTRPRTYDADVITLGDPFVTLPEIPANTDFTEYETECFSSCTQSFPHEIIVFQSFPHMHQVGSEIWTTQWRDGEQIAQRGRIEFWSFDHQTTQSVNFTIQPGDRLNTHCVYNTLGVSVPTRFGIASDQEMCMHFLSYYPRVLTDRNVPYSFCGRAGRMSVCGDATGTINVANPQTKDPLGGVKRTFGESASSCEFNVPQFPSPSTDTPTPSSSSASDSAPISS